MSKYLKSTSPNKSGSSSVLLQQTRSPPLQPRSNPLLQAGSSPDPWSANRNAPLTPRTSALERAQRFLASTATPPPSRAVRLPVTSSPRTPLNRGRKSVSASSLSISDVEGSLISLAESELPSADGSIVIRNPAAKAANREKPVVATTQRSAQRSTWQSQMTARKPVVESSPDASNLSQFLADMDHHQQQRTRPAPAAVGDTNSFISISSLTGEVVQDDDEDADDLPVHGPPKPVVPVSSFGPMPTEVSAQVVVAKPAAVVPAVAVPAASPIRDRTAPVSVAASVVDDESMSMIATESIAEEESDQQRSASTSSARSGSRSVQTARTTASSSAASKSSSRLSVATGKSASTSARSSSSASSSTRRTQTSQRRRSTAQPSLLPTKAQGGGYSEDFDAFVDDPTTIFSQAAPAPLPPPPAVGARQQPPATMPMPQRAVAPPPNVASIANPAAHPVYMPSFPTATRFTASSIPSLGTDVLAASIAAAVTHALTAISTLNAVSLPPPPPGVYAAPTAVNASANVRRRRRECCQCCLSSCHAHASSRSAATNQAPSATTKKKGVVLGQEQMDALSAMMSAQMALVDHLATFVGEPSSGPPPATTTARPPFTTLAATQKFLQQNRPRTISFEEALAQVREEQQNHSFIEEVEVEVGRQSRRPIDIAAASGRITRAAAV
ncbi:hypothetical protein BC828DRAFT_395283 [Blastocladiella britannica]|nr:hypothetical protein BC828DRAFT_395283 [Blastocladiella britannica]